MKDGIYTIEVSLTGGTGRSSVQSPAELEIENGVMTAEIVWSSNSYDYMEINGNEYFPVSSDEFSTFLVEIPALDTDITMLAETLAMSEPHLIEYTLNFNSSTLKETGSFPVLWIAIVAATLIGCITVVFAVKRKKKNETD